MNYVNLDDFRERASRRLEPAFFDYFDGGAQDEVTLRANRSAFDAIKLRPRILRGASAGAKNLEVDLFGATLSMPVIVSPTAFHKLAHPDGERATARAAGAACTVMTVSMASTMPVEDIAKEIAAAGNAPKPWFQLYVQPDRGFTTQLISRVEAAGCGALVITADSPVFGRHERDIRHGFTDLPAGLDCPNMRIDGTVRRIEFDPALCWRDIDWMRSVSKLPLVVKGVAHPDDARLAVEHGAHAVIVSNHGGRQLDTVAASIALLPAIVDAVDGEVPVLMDGGIRRGTDIIKALSFGATAVGVGRPVLWGLATDGAAGVTKVLEFLRGELVDSLALCGCRALHDLGPGLLFEGLPWVR